MYQRQQQEASKNSKQMIKDMRKIGENKCKSQKKKKKKEKERPTDGCLLNASMNLVPSLPTEIHLLPDSIRSQLPNHPAFYALEATTLGQRKVAVGKDDPEPRS